MPALVSSALRSPFKMMMKTNFQTSGFVVFFPLNGILASQPVLTHL